MLNLDIADRKMNVKIIIPLKFAGIKFVMCKDILNHADTLKQEAVDLEITVNIVTKNRTMKKNFLKD